MRRNCLCNPHIFRFRMIGRADFTCCENFKRFHRSKLKKIKIKAELPLVNASLCGVLAQERKSLYYLILTTGNDSPNLVYYVLVTFSDLEEKNIKDCLYKHSTGARVNIKQKPYGATLTTNSKITFDSLFLNTL